MCYTGKCPYESYGADNMCWCRRGENPCPADELEAEQAEEIQEEVEQDALEDAY